MDNTNKLETVNAEEVVRDLLKDCGIACAATYLKETEKDGWKCDQWKISFKQVGKETFSLDFFCGLGHREKSPFHSRGKPIAPSPATILHSVLLDSNGTQGSFDEWCAEWGVDSDSLKALCTYSRCKEQSEQALVFFGQPLLDKLQEALQDY